MTQHQITTEELDGISRALAIVQQGLERRDAEIEQYRRALDRIRSLSSDDCAKIAREALDPKIEEPKP